MKMFLTRFGRNSKAVITGDITQSDLARSETSGLVQASQILPGTEGIAFIEFTEEDVVRHSIVQRIIEAYDSLDSS
jgi:phosphate starvation-inducible PhoH-like protein